MPELLALALCAQNAQLSLSVHVASEGIVAVICWQALRGCELSSSPSPSSSAEESQQAKSMIASRMQERVQVI